MLSSVSPASRTSSAARNRPYSFRRKPAFERAIAQRDVVRLRAGEVLQRRAAALGGNEPKVHLEAAADEDARLRGAVAEHALDQGKLRERLHDAERGGILAGLDGVARMSRSPQVSVPRRRLPTTSKVTPGARSSR